MLQSALRAASPSERPALEARLRDAEQRFGALDAQWSRVLRLRVSLERQGVMWETATESSGARPFQTHGLDIAGYGLGAALVAVIAWRIMRRRSVPKALDPARIARIEQHLEGLETDVAQVQASQRFTEELLRGGASVARQS
jgi:hypothetical protein